VFSFIYLFGIKSTILEVMSFVLLFLGHGHARSISFFLALLQE